MPMAQVCFCATVFIAA